ncbi:MAG: IS5/IS1182 family transposase, partial [Deltaproteobacteria bacterium]
MGLIAHDDGWRIPDELWELMEPHIPRVKTKHPLGCHR